MENLAKVVGFNVVLLGTLLCAQSAWSMDALTQDQLSMTTGQDGVTIQVLPSLVSGTPTLPINSVIYTDNNGIPVANLAGYTSAASLRTDLTKVQFFGKATADVANATAYTGLLSNPVIAMRIDSSGGGVASATTGANPNVLATLTMPNVRTISTFFNNANSRGTGHLVGLTPLGVIATGNLAASSASITPILSVGTYASGNSSATPRMNINLVSDLSIAFNFGAPAATSMIVLNSANIESINFNGDALNFESPNATTGYGSAASRLSVTPSISQVNLSGATVGVLTTSLMQTVFPAATTGGVLIQDASLTVGGVALNNLTAGTVGGVSTTMAGNTTFAAGIANAPMGSLGVTNMTVSNLKIGVTGM